MDFFKDLWGFLKERKKYWMLPRLFRICVFHPLTILRSSQETEKANTASGLTYAGVSVLNGVEEMPTA